MNQAAAAEFTGVPGKESRVRQTHPEGPAMLLDRTLAAICCRRRSGLTTTLLRLDRGGDLRQQEAARLLTETHVRGSPGAMARRRGGQQEARF